VIVATPLPALRTIGFDPALPERVAEAVLELQIGPIVKTPLIVDRWPHEWMTTDRAAQRWYHHNPHETNADLATRAVVTTYTGADDARALAQMTVAERIDSITAQFLAASGSSRPRVFGAGSVAWGTEPRFLGAYSVYAPGQLTRYWDALRTPFSNVHLAGEYTSIYGGYMEGGVESGERAAAWVLDRGQAAAVSTAGQTRVTTWPG
jgi:monoamine oxidase